MFNLKKRNYENITADGVMKVMKDNNIKIIDVREANEFSRGHIPSAQLIPLGSLSQRLNEIDQNKKIIVVCASGGRSSRAAGILGEAGYEVSNMMGGMMAWSGPIS